MTFPTTLPRTERILLCLALVVIIIICMGVGNLFGKSGTGPDPGPVKEI